MALADVNGCRRRAGQLTASLALAVGLLVAAPESAHAQSTIKNPGDRAHYAVELEPHLVLGPFDPPGPGPGADGGYGLGLRASFEIARDGFIQKLNDSVSLGVGLDVLQYDGDARGECETFEPGLNGTRICTEVSGSGNTVHYLLPVVMQWNFWLSRRWSVFGEPGLLLSYGHDDLGVSPFVLYAGGRLHFSESVALTLRIGYPTFSLGVSFLF